MSAKPDGGKLAHFVSSDPFDPRAVEVLTPEQERYYAASQWKLIWWKLKRHKLGLFSAWFLLLGYASILISEVIAPYNLNFRHPNYIYAPPQRIHFLHEGTFAGPFVYGLDYRLNMENLERIYTPNPNEIHRLRFFCRGDSYRYFGFIPADFHLVCPDQRGEFFLMGTDRLGRDIFSRLVHGARISLTVGLVGISISFVMGVMIGGLAGYYGGMVDALVQRAIEIIRSFPELPLWMTLSAAIPVKASPLLVFFGITLILGVMDWTGLARAVRSKLLALREEDFALAAILMGARPPRIIFRHLLPNFISHLIVSVTLSVPTMILGETALSFLGLGLRPPLTSWGVMLNEAQNINAVTLYPWLLFSILPVFLVVLAFNFLGDGLRDAADPYS